MIIHVVAFKWKPGIPPGHVATVQSQLLEFVVEPCPRCARTDAGATSASATWQNFDFAIVAEFDTVDDWRVYDKHPRHEEIRAGVVRPWIETRASVQFET